MTTDIKNSAPTNQPRGSCCAWCGTTEGLKPFIVHHPAGRANELKLTIRLCPMCAARGDELLRKHDLPLKHDAERSLPEVVVAVLVGIALVLFEWAKRLFFWAARLDAFKDALDTLPRLAHDAGGAVVSAEEIAIRAWAQPSDSGAFAGRGSPVMGCRPMPSCSTPRRPSTRPSVCFWHRVASSAWTTPTTRGEAACKRFWSTPTTCPAAIRGGLPSLTLRGRTRGRPRRAELSQTAQARRGVSSRGSSTTGPTKSPPWSSVSTWSLTSRVWRSTWAMLAARSEAGSRLCSGTTRLPKARAGRTPTGRASSSRA